MQDARGRTLDARRETLYARRKRQDAVRKTLDSVSQHGMVRNLFQYCGAGQVFNIMERSTFDLNCSVSGENA
jgi:hypothetical protein